MNALQYVTRCGNCRSIHAEPRCPRCGDAWHEPDPELALYLRFVQGKKNEQAHCVGRLCTLMRRQRHVAARASKSRNSYDAAEASALDWALRELRSAHPSEFAEAARRMGWKDAGPGSGGE